jgi:hypothetical protein
MAGNDTSRDIILSDIAVLLNLYIDYGDLDVSTATEQCPAHYLIAAVQEVTSDLGILSYGKRRAVKVIPDHPK